MANLQADLSLGVDVRVETGATAVSGDAGDRGGLGRVFLRHVSGLSRIVWLAAGACIPLPKRTANCGIWEKCQKIRSSRAAWKAGRTHLEETKFIGSIWRANDQGANGSNVAVPAGDGESFVRATSVSNRRERDEAGKRTEIRALLDIAQLLRFCQRGS